jgi:hypothetical protein
MKVPRVEAKLRVFAFRITFSSQVYFWITHIWFRMLSSWDNLAFIICFPQVDDLRRNLNSINDATREVSLKIIGYEVRRWMFVCSEYLMHNILSGKRIREIASDNANNSHSGKCFESGHCTRYHSACESYSFFCLNLLALYLFLYYAISFHTTHLYCRICCRIQIGQSS